jgi:hypothetical protein
VDFIRLSAVVVVVAAVELKLYVVLVVVDDSLVAGWQLLGGKHGRRLWVRCVG